MVKLQRAQRVGKKFQNPVPTELGGFSLMWKVLPLFLSNRAEREPQTALGPFRTDVKLFEQAPARGLRVTWFGHSSMLLEMDGVRLLVDPVWDERAAPVQWFGPKRFFSPTMRLEEMPNVEAVVISHDHYDHLGKGTVKRLAELMPEVRWITARGVGAELQGFGVSTARVTELDWTESTVIRAASGAELRVTAIPTRHFSGRSVVNRDETLWMGMVLQGANHRIYCGADSGWWEGFEAIGREYGPFDLSMLEIGAFNELWRDIHLGPAGAVQAFQALGGSGLMMPIHWGLFDLALHAWRQPIEELVQIADGEGLRLFSPEPGVPTEVVDGAEVRSGWWQSGERVKS